MQSVKEVPELNCPFCAEEIKEEAVVCRYCRQNIVLFDHVIIRGAELYDQKIKPTFEEWKSKLINEFGEEARQHLDEIWRKFTPKTATESRGTEARRQASFHDSKVKPEVMNRNQRAVLIIGFLLILVMFLIPPWRSITDIPQIEYGKVLVPRGHTESFDGYHFLFGGYGYSGGSRNMSVMGVEYYQVETPVYVTVRLDYYRLIAQIGVVVLLTGLRT